MRLHRVEPEFTGRVVVRRQPFPLELLRGEGPPRDILEQEWWLAAIQEPEAQFTPYPPDDWPTTTLPAFEAVWAAAQQGEATAADFDLRVRRAFFGQGRNIGRREVLTALADEAGLDLLRFERDLANPEARRAGEQEARLGREEFQERGTPTLMLGDGTRPHPHLPEKYDFRNGKLWPNRRPGLGVTLDPKPLELQAEITERSRPIPMLERPDGSFTNW